MRSAVGLVGSAGALGVVLALVAACGAGPTVVGPPGDVPVPTGPETAPQAEVVAPLASTGQPDYRVDSWMIEGWRWPEVLQKTQEYIGACRPWLTGLPRPCRTTYTHQQTTMSAYCTTSEGRLSHEFQTYAEGDTESDVQERDFRVEHDAQGRVVVEELTSSYNGDAAHTGRCRFAYEGDATAPSWQACDGDRRSAHFVYDDAGRLAERYEAEKRTTDLAELQAWVPPDGVGYWSYVDAYRYDEAGRLVDWRHCNGQTPRWCYFEATYTYDQAGRAVQLERTDHDAAAPNWVTKWIYDARGLMVRAEEAFPQGHRITDIDYDSAGLPTTVRVRTHAPQTEDRYVVRIEHAGPSCEYRP